jgi:tRNA (guanine-N7-)-methyltransferase
LWTICAGHTGRVRPTIDTAARDSVSDSFPPYRYLGRKRGRRLRPNRQARLEEDARRLLIAPPEETHGPIDPRTELFPSAQAIWMEIGFGAGEHLAALARTHPHIGFIGVDPYVNGVASLLRFVETYQLTNVRLIMEDARIVFSWFKESSIDRLYVLFPDPWPKRRHVDRRLLKHPTMDEIVWILEPGGDLRFASDHRGYAIGVQGLFSSHPEMEIVDQITIDGGLMPHEWLKTRYQEKAESAGKPIHYFRFRRNATRP